MGCLSGKKTYALSVAAIFALAAAYANHQISGNEAIKGLFQPAVAATLRAAIGTVEGLVASDPIGPQETPQPVQVPPEPTPEPVPAPVPASAPVEPQPKAKQKRKPKIKKI